MFYILLKTDNKKLKIVLKIAKEFVNSECNSFAFEKLLVSFKVRAEPANNITLRQRPKRNPDDWENDKGFALIWQLSKHLQNSDSPSTPYSEP